MGSEMCIRDRVIVCDIYLAAVLLLFVSDIFKYSAEATWMANIYIILSNVIFYFLLPGAGVETAECFFFRTSSNVIVVRNWKAVESPWKPILQPAATQMVGILFPHNR